MRHLSPAYEQSKEEREVARAHTDIDPRSSRFDVQYVGSQLIGGIRYLFSEPKFRKISPYTMKAMAFNGSKLLHTSESGH